MKHKGLLSSLAVMLLWGLLFPAVKLGSPVFAAVFGWLLLGEDVFNINYILAFILICADILIANIRRSPKPAVAAAPKM